MRVVASLQQGACLARGGLGALLGVGHSSLGALDGLPGHALRLIRRALGCLLAALVRLCSRVLGLRTRASGLISHVAKMHGKLTRSLQLQKLRIHTNTSSAAAVTLA